MKEKVEEKVYEMKIFFEEKKEITLFIMGMSFDGNFLVVELVEGGLKFFNTGNILEVDVRERYGK